MTTIVAAQPVSPCRSRSATEIDVDELVAVQGEQVSRLLSCGDGQANAAPTSERLRLRHGHDVGAEPGQLGLEQILLPLGTADEHAPNPCSGEKPYLVGGQGPPGDLDQRFRPSLRRRAEALGLATGQDDGFHAAGYWSVRGFKPLAIASMVSFESLLRSVFTTQ